MLLVEHFHLDGARQVLGGRPPRLAGELYPESRFAETTPFDSRPAALVSLARPRNIDMVIVDGRILHRGGRFAALDHATAVREAQEAAHAVRARAGWPPA
jgi:hypothetical protein